MQGPVARARLAEAVPGMGSRTMVRTDSSVEVVVDGKAMTERGR